MTNENEVNKVKKLFSNTALFALGNIGSSIILFLLLPLYTNVLTTEEYGIINLVTTFSNLLIPIFQHLRLQPISRMTDHNCMYVQIHTFPLPSVYMPSGFLLYNK